MKLEGKNNDSLVKVVTVNIVIADKKIREKFETNKEIKNPRIIFLGEIGWDK